MTYVDEIYNVFSADYGNSTMDMLDNGGNSVIVRYKVKHKKRAYLLRIIVVEDQAASRMSDIMSTHSSMMQGMIGIGGNDNE